MRKKTIKFKVFAIVQKGEPVSANTIIAINKSRKPILDFAKSMDARIVPIEVTYSGK